MAIEAPVHGERCNLINARHLIDPTVAAHAADTVVHVHRVIEVDEIRKIVHAVVPKRHVREIAVTDRLQYGALVPHLVVTAHAEIGGRDPRGGRLVDSGVAVAAVDAFVLRVVSMIEGDRLIERLEFPSAPRCADEDEEPRQSSHNAYRDERETEPKRGIAPRRKKRGHAARITDLSRQRSCAADDARYRARFTSDERFTGGCGLRAGLCFDDLDGNPVHARR